METPQNDVQQGVGDKPVTLPSRFSNHTPNTRLPPHRRWPKMKTLIQCGLAICLLILHLHAGDPPANVKDEYRRLEKITDRAGAIVEQLQAIKLQGVTIEGVAPSAALEALRKKVVGETGGGVINFVIRGSERGQRVTIKSDKTTYAQAIDQICVQSGRAWSIEFNEDAGTPILIIKEAKGQQGGGGQPATRPKTK